MPVLDLIGSLLVWPLRTGANSLTGIVLTIGLMMLVFLASYLWKKARQLISEDGP